MKNGTVDVIGFNVTNSDMIDRMTKFRFRYGKEPSNIITSKQVFSLIKSVYDESYPDNDDSPKSVYGLDVKFVTNIEQDFILCQK